MRFYIAGSGNMAWFLVKKLTGAGHRCAGIYGRNSEAVQALAGAFALPVCQTVAQIKDDADCCILAVPDTVIRELAAQLSFTNTVLLHTSGATGIGLLAPAARHHGVAWFVYSIVKTDLPLHRDIPCVFETSSGRAAEILQTIITATTDVAFEADEEKRKWLHLGAVFGNNFTNHLVSITEELCREHDVPFALLKPILAQTMQRITHQSPLGLQTGPARRNDTDTIARHLEMLENHSEWQRVYEAVNQSIRDMYNIGSGKNP